MRIVDIYNWYIRQPIKYRYIRIKNFIRYLSNHKEYITHSAILVRGIRPIIVLGKRHHICLHRAAKHNLVYKNNEFQGFYTNKKRFVGRKEAFLIALKSKQIIRIIPSTIEEYLAFSPFSILYSEDLW